MKLLILKDLEGKMLIIPYKNICYIEIYKTASGEKRVKLYLKDGSSLRILDELIADDILYEFSSFTQKIKVKIGEVLWQLKSLVKNLLSIVKKK